MINNSRQKYSFQSVFQKIRNFLEDNLPYRLLKKIKSLAGVIRGEKIFSHYFGQPIISGPEGNDLIGRLLGEDKSLMIARFGSLELECLKYYLKYRKDKKNKKQYKNSLKFKIENTAGFFPATDEMLDKLGEAYVEHIKNIDILAVWFKKGEKDLYKNYFSNAQLVRVGCISPFVFENPWTAKLAGKKVLVVHPFQETIENQYKNTRERIFENKEVLPLFHLETVRAVQSLAGNETGFKDWFEAYQYMCDEIKKKDFDIAIIGAGAYGLPLASFVKSLGKKAIHMAGATQLLFGIKGKRWDKDEFVSKKLYNEHWVRPSKSETPKDFKVVEGGSYW